MKKFFFEVFRKFAVSIVSTILFAVVFFFLVGGIFASLLESPKPDVQPSSFLVLDLTTVSYTHLTLPTNREV